MDKAVVLPVQPLYSVPASAAEKKQRVCEGVQIELLPHQRGKAVDALSEIRVPAGDVHLTSAHEVTQHGSEPDRA